MAGGRGRGRKGMERQFSSFQNFLKAFFYVRVTEKSKFQFLVSVFNLPLYIFRLKKRLVSHCASDPLSSAALDIIHQGRKIS